MCKQTIGYFKKLIFVGQLLDEEQFPTSMSIMLRWKTPIQPLTCPPSIPVAREEAKKSNPIQFSCITNSQQHA